MTSLIRDGVQERLENAISQGEPEAGSTVSSATESEVETTPEEIDGFNIIRAICASKIAPERIVMRDAKSYCAVLLDDNNRRSIARMYFNSPTSRYLAIMVGKEENRVPLAKPVEIYQHANALLERVTALIGDIS